MTFLLRHATQSFLAVMSLGWATMSGGAPVLDRIDFGVSASEAAHACSTEASAVRAGPDDTPCRVLLPLDPPTWEGGRIAFRMQVDPERQTYFTARFWGGEANENMLVLFCEGKQVGYRHLGDIDVLCPSDQEPSYTGRFQYVTTPLPISITRGRTTVDLEIRSTGRIWPYGTTFEQYQKPMSMPSRQLFAVVTHLDPASARTVFHEPKQPPMPPVRTAPDNTVFQKLYTRINGRLDRMLTSPEPLTQMQAAFLARAFSVSWTTAYRNPRAVEQVIRVADARYDTWQKTPDAIWQDASTWNPGWFGLGPLGEAVTLLASAIGDRLDEPLPMGDGRSRRACWLEMFAASRDYLRMHRRAFANQTMYVDLNLYLSHRVMTVLDPAAAWPEEQGRRYLHEAFGIRPWTGSDPGGAADPKRGYFRNYWGHDFRQITAKGLSRELGYVGHYGEILALLVQAYEATTPAAEDGSGDPQLLDMIRRVQRARMYFCYPLPDADGFRAMRRETAVGWRDPTLSGPVTYLEHSAPLRPALLSREPHAIGAAQQMLTDNQFFASVADMLDDRRFRPDFTLLTLPDDYEALRRLPSSEQGLPMRTGGPHVVFADEEAGVVAVKHGDEIFYASLYWRAQYAINGLARVHFMAPTWQQIAVVAVTTEAHTMEKSWRRPNRTNQIFGNGGPKYPVATDSAHAGEALPVHAMPPDVAYDHTRDNPYAGRADCYQLRFGPYFVAMNTTADRSFEVTVPDDMPHAIDLVSGRSWAAAERLTIGPRSTVVVRE